MTLLKYRSVLFFPVWKVSWDSLCWTFTPESFTESFITAPTPQTARLDRSHRSALSRKSLLVGLLCVMWDLTVWIAVSLPQEETGAEVASSPPESSFQKLAPSETRYTILRRDRDELWPQQPPSDPVTQCHALGSGRGFGWGQASGTEQQHPTPLLKRRMEEEGGAWRGSRRF